MAATKFNVGDTVYLPVKIADISIDSKGIVYNIYYTNCFGNISKSYIREADLKEITNGSET